MAKKIGGPTRFVAGAIAVILAWFLVISPIIGFIGSLGGGGSGEKIELNGTESTPMPAATVKVQTELGLIDVNAEGFNYDHYVMRGGIYYPKVQVQTELGPMWVDSTTVDLSEYNLQNGIYVKKPEMVMVRTEMGDIEVNPNDVDLSNYEPQKNLLGKVVYVQKEPETSTGGKKITGDDDEGDEYEYPSAPFKLFSRDYFTQYFPTPKGYSIRLNDDDEGKIPTIEWFKQIQSDSDDWSGSGSNEGVKRNEFYRTAMDNKGIVYWVKLNGGTGNGREFWTLYTDKNDNLKALHFDESFYTVSWDSDDEDPSDVFIKPTPEPVEDKPEEESTGDLSYDRATGGESEGDSGESDTGGLSYKRATE